jgi:hypothetical protein
MILNLFGNDEASGVVVLTCIASEIVHPEVRPKNHSDNTFGYCIQHSYITGVCEIKIYIHVTCVVYNHGSSRDTFWASKLLIC